MPGNLLDSFRWDPPSAQNVGKKGADLFGSAGAAERDDQNRIKWPGSLHKTDYMAAAAPRQTPGPVRAGDRIWLEAARIGRRSSAAVK